MARTNNNKYNYSHILQRDPSSSPASYSSVTRSNGRMLVLTKPSPKPLKSSSAATATTPPPPSPAPTKTPDQTISDPDPNQISLRPLGHTGPASSLSFPARTPESEKHVAPPAPMSVSPKPHKFIRVRDCLTRNNRGRGISGMDRPGDPNRAGMRGFDPIQNTWVDQDPAGNAPAPPDDDELAGFMSSYSLDDGDGNYYPCVPC
ncbi:hypothetical protein HID58_035410 [Brassica napus]|uniref:Uncharacterized protein n=1 Tax=Brassica napus TaxID=3708 RepID=A0ABQ8C4V1_BRANA|nr:hypothetical protein HID58_035410 [Brassica napus]